MKKEIRFTAMLLCMALGLGNVAQAQKAVSSAGGHDYVDLGLPSGTLWATCNVGASKPEDYGNYYAWGETKPQASNTYDWNTYKYANGAYDKLTKYCDKSDRGNNGFTDNLTILEPGDDAATANWGSGWRTPTKEQWDELLANTTHQWTTQNGVEGRKFTSKKNGATLFLPAAGYPYKGKLKLAGRGGYYLSRSLFTDDPSESWCLVVLDFVCSFDSWIRCFGRSVRPVRQK